MKDIQMFEAVGEVDGDLLADAEAFLNRTAAVRKKPRPWVKWGSLAACAAVAVCAVWAVRAWTPEHTSDPIASEEVRPSVSQPVPPAQEVGEATVDAPAVDPEQISRPIVSMHFNRLDSEPEPGTAALFDLLVEDFVPMNREELLEYFGVTLPLEEILPDFFAVEPEDAGFGRGIYRGGERGAYFDTNTFSFESADGVLGVYVTLDKAFHLPVLPWELPGDELRFTVINGWELALFRYPDEEGNQYFRTEFRQNGVNYTVTGKNMAEQQYAAVLAALLEERDGYAPGEVRTFRGTYSGGIGHQTLTTAVQDGCVTVEESWHGPLHLHLDSGEAYSSLAVALTPEQAEAFRDLAIGDRVEVSFTGEPATVGTVWKQQLISLEKVGG